MIYPNFESVLLPQSGCRNNVKKSWTEKRQLYKPCGAAVYVKSSDPHFFSKPVVLLGENVVEEFLDRAISTANEIRHFLANKIKME